MSCNSFRIPESPINTNKWPVIKLTGGEHGECNLETTRNEGEPTLFNDGCLNIKECLKAQQRRMCRSCSDASNDQYGRAFAGSFREDQGGQAQIHKGRRDKRDQPQAENLNGLKTTGTEAPNDVQRGEEKIDGNLSMGQDRKPIKNRNTASWAAILDRHK
ncbi:hypothetical protein Ancab_022133, partial [Ancistrocladus abbreviatus]